MGTGVEKVTISSLDSSARKTIEKLLGASPTCECSNFHHGVADRHSWDVECPCLLRYERALEDVRLLLALDKG